jgi:anti-sigma regulatory factor (Ser/Thr protein kinase)
MTAAGEQPHPLEPTAEGDGATVLDTVLATTEAAPAEARATVGKLLDAVDPSGGITDDSLLLVSELVTNTVRHAAEGPDGRVRIRVEWRPQCLRVDVWDWGPGFEPRGRYVRPAPDAESGFGLFLVDSLAARWGVEVDEHTRVWFELVPPPRP